MTARRIIFVPGMKPKPQPEIHIGELRRCLLSGLAWARPEAARKLRADPSCLTLVPWTYRFYGSYRDIALDKPGIDAILHEPDPSDEDVAEIESLARKVRRWMHLLGDSLPRFSRIIARPEMRLTMSEARRYLNDIRGIATEVRAMVRAPLREAWNNGEEVLLIGHSLGSVIAYDTLWELSHQEGLDQRVDLFVTLGSPLASRLIRENLCGVARTGEERYPTNIRNWKNFAARGELTALRPRLERYFGEMVGLGILDSLEDHVDLYNHFRGDIGLNVHKSYGYLINDAVAGTIGDWLLA
jgi:pimeloyl-ACP methyl ester carboxylesterase